MLIRAVLKNVGLLMRVSHVFSASTSSVSPRTSVTSRSYGMFRAFQVHIHFAILGRRVDNRFPCLAHWRGDLNTDIDYVVRGSTLCSSPAGLRDTDRAIASSRVKEAQPTHNEVIT